MELVKLKVMDLLAEGWRLTKQHLGFLLTYQVVLYLFSTLIVGSALGYFRSLLVHVALFLFVVIAKIGFFRSILLIVDGAAAGYEQLYCNWKLFGSWFVASVLFFMMMMVGLSLFVIPGLWVLARFGLYPYFIVDHGLGSIDALKNAFNASRPYAWELLWLFLACGLVDVIGGLAFGVGLLIAVPVTLIAQATAYRLITRETE